MSKPHKHADVIKEHAARFVYAGGALLWADDYGPRARKGRPAGSVDSHGYLQVKIGGKSVLVHRIVWFMHHGTLPEQIDHMNRDRLDNRIENLRPSDSVHNTQNAGIRADNTSGFAGVHRSVEGRWVARICVSRRRFVIGSYATIEEAAAARSAAKAAHHPHALESMKGVHHA